MSERTFEEELLHCPDCGEAVAITDEIESNGQGIAFGYIECGSCSFEAREEWVHDRTVEMVDDE